MTSLGLEPWEPEESVGKIWHVFASKLAPSQEHDGARVDLAEMRGRLSVLFRGLGGNPAVEVKPVAPERSGHRLGFLQRRRHSLLDEVFRDLELLRFLLDDSFVLQ